METKRKAVPPGVKQLVPRLLWGMADLKGPFSPLYSAPRLFWALLPGIGAHGTHLYATAHCTLLSLELESRNRR